MPFRHEWKHRITALDRLVLRQRLGAVMQPDAHARDGTYRIRSLYFDDPRDTALREKLDGVNRREKFRIRCYNGDHSLIRLEKKCKVNGLCEKLSVPMTEEQVEKLLAGDTGWMESAEPLLQELRCKMQWGLRPKTLVDYTREAWVFAPGNVRVTLDYDIRTGLRCTDFLDPDCPTVPAGDPTILMEVKWDGFLPGIIEDAIWLEGRRAEAFSKYAACRIYG